jgi:DNA helicase HerA-like ATPase
MSETVSLNTPGRILLGKGHAHQWLELPYANRHGLIAGATGTGKTVTLQVLAEGFSRAGVPVFMADVKGDLAGISHAGKPHAKTDERVQKIGIADHAFAAFPVTFWDMFARQGHALRTTVSQMGPLLLSRLMDLSDAQTGVLQIAFTLAEDEGWLLLDMKDLRALLTHVSENAKSLGKYGLVSSASVGAVLRKLLELEAQGAEKFFGEPALDIADLMHVAPDGRGMVNILAADELLRAPKLYSTFLLWLLSELFELLPEVGDAEKPKLVFFFDEAHLLFDEAPKALREKIEQVVRLIRSKGVGVYFVTQSPLDVPEEVLGQLGNRVQHALRAFAPKDQKAVRTAAQTFRPNPAFRTEEAITMLGVGEGLVSTLDSNGVPQMADQVLICPPASRIGPITPEERATMRSASIIGTKYDAVLDRESAYELLQKRAEQTAEPASKPRPTAQMPSRRSPWGGASTTSAPKRSSAPKRTTTTRSSNRQTYTEAAGKSILRSIGSTLGRELGKTLMRGLKGGLKK